jgi:hypothetical protein
MIKGHEQLKHTSQHIINVLFGAPGEGKGNFSLDKSQTVDITQVSNQENAFLHAPYTVEEVQKSFFFQMDHNQGFFSRPRFPKSYQKPVIPVTTDKL